MNLALYQLERGELMNYIVWLSLLLSFFSCQSIENKSGFSSLISTKIENNKAKDSDYDGISDEEEKDRGWNPYIANIPDLQVRLLSGALKSSQREVKIKAFPNELKKTLLNLIYKKENGFSPIEDENIFLKTPIQPLGCINYRLGSVYTDYLDLDLSFKFFNTEGVKEVRNAQTNFFNHTGPLFSLHEEKQIKRKSIPFHKIVYNCISIADINFDYKIGTEFFNYKYARKKVQNKLAHFVIVLPDKIVKQSIDSNHYSLVTFIAEMKSKFNSNNHKKKWYFISSRINKITDKLIAGELYYLIPLEASEVKLTYRNKKQIKGVVEANKIVLNNLKKGDELIVEIIPQISFVFPDNKQALNPGTSHNSQNLGRREHSESACMYTKKISYNREHLEDLIKRPILNLHINEKMVPIKILKNSLEYHYTVPSSSKVVELDFNLLSSNSFLYQIEEIWEDIGKVGEFEVLTCNKEPSQATVLYSEVKPKKKYRLEYEITHISY